MSGLDPARLAQVFEDLYEELQREANQSILKRDHAQGMFALGGMDGLERFERRIKYDLRPEAFEPKKAIRQKVSLFRGVR